jgi:hypothetical protein
MLATDVYKLPIGLSLGIIVLMLGVATAASLLWPRDAAEGSGLLGRPAESRDQPSTQAPGVSPARSTSPPGKTGW